MVDTEVPCNNCGEDAPPVSDPASGDLICTNCGAVMQDHNIDDGADWRIFADTSEAEKQAKNRAGTKVNPYLANGVETSYIGNRALNRANQVAQGTENRILLQVFEQLKRIQVDLHFSDAALDSAFEFASKLDRLKPRALRTRPADHVILVYLACRQEEEGRSLHEIAAVVSDASKTDITRAYNRVEKLLPRAVQRALKTEVVPETFLPRFSNRLGLSTEVQKVARMLCEAPEVINRGRSQHAAVTLAALYLIAWLSNIDLPLSHVASVGEVGESTLAECINRMKPLIAEILPSSFKRLRNIRDMPRFTR